MSDYELSVDGYTGNVVDPLTTNGFGYANGMKFSTKYQDDDSWLWNQPKWTISWRSAPFLQ